VRVSEIAKIEKQVDEGRKAEALIAAGILDFLAERQEGARAGLVAWFRNSEGQARDPNISMAFAAVLAEIATQREELEHKKRQAERGRQKLMGNTKTAGD
jgi:hypothetical protein